MDQMKWDTKKHDAQIPDKPKVVELNCPECGEKGFFAQLTRMIAQITLPNVGLSPTPSPNFICTKCSNVITTEMFIHGLRKKLDQQTP